MADSDHDDEFFECPDINTGSQGDSVVFSRNGDTKLNGFSALQIHYSEPDDNGGAQVRHKGSLEYPTSQELSVWGGRASLPAPMFSRSAYSVWSILKHCIGMELSKITMPVMFNEPLSFLQRMVEYMEYSMLLQRASDSNDPIERHELVTAFAVSAHASNWDRIGKPFNPLLGETYELDREDLGFRIICEQVSHHPPVSAFHVESRHYSFHGSINPKIKFWGKSVEVTPKGLVTLHLKRHNETYSWQNVNCCVHNIIVGKIWVEHYGSMEVTNHKTQYRAVLNFLPSGWFGRDLHKIEGFLLDESKRKVKAFYGKWVDALFSYNVEIWDEYVKSIATQSGSSSSGSKSSKKNRASVTDSRSSDNNSSSSPLRQSLSKTYSEPAMTSVAARSADDTTDDVPARVSTFNLRLPTQKLLWEAMAKPSNNSIYYSFTSFALLLNELTKCDEARIAPTDSRFRPDIRRMEEGLMDAAAEEKNRIEEKQRAANRERKKRKEDELSPLWFKAGVNQHTNKDDWLFTGDYWRRNWSKCPDIF